MDNDTKLQVGFTAPMIRTDPFALPEAPKQRRPIGFVHFGEPEPDHAVCVAAYVKLVMDGEHRDEPELRDGDENDPELPF